MNERVRVVLPAGVSFSDRVHQSAGTTEVPKGIVGYEASAVIPKPPWDSVSRWEMQELLEGAQITAGGTVALTKVPLELYNLFDELREAQCQNSRSLRACLAEPRHNQGVQRFAEFVRCFYGRVDYLSRRTGRLAGGIHVTATGFPTITVNPVTRLRVGLHLDDWSGLPLTERATAGNRICYNIGTRPRYFLFSDRSISKICQAIVDSDPDAIRNIPRGGTLLAGPVTEWHTRVGGTNVGRAFMVLFPTLPIYRLEMQPGEAYIADTENIIHDGGCENWDSMDMTLTLRGHFSVAQVHSDSPV